MSDSEKHGVLLVDDEAEVLYSLKGLLRREYDLFTAESGAEALEILANHPIHVVMTDQRMPEMTGAELLGRVRNRYPDAIRIIFTGYADIKDVIKAINTGNLFRYITKPWDPDELIGVLRDAVAEYEATVAQRRLLENVQAFAAESVAQLETLSAESGAPKEKTDELVQWGRDLQRRLEPLVPQGLQRASNNTWGAS